VAIGEVGLLGELRPVPGLERRLREAARLGFRRAIVAGGGRGQAVPSTVDGLAVVPVLTLRDAVEAALEPASGRVASAPARC
jgi:DNA repair protein RadA/Sms